MRSTDDCAGKKRLGDVNFSVARKYLDDVNFNVARKKRLGDVINL